MQLCCELETLADRSKLRLKGPATLPFIGELLSAIRTALEEVQQLEIDCAGVTEVDLSCLQLLCSAHRTAIAAGKDLTLSGVGDGPLRGVSFEAGFQREGVCPRNTSDKNCLWQSNSCPLTPHSSGEKENA